VLPEGLGKFIHLTVSRTRDLPTPSNPYLQILRQYPLKPLPYANCVCKIEKKKLYIRVRVRARACVCVCVCNSPGSDQIPAKLIQAGGETLRFEIHKPIHSIWNKEEFSSMEGAYYFTHSQKGL
jgi:hypothetical protein